MHKRYIVLILILTVLIAISFIRCKVEENAIILSTLSPTAAVAHMKAFLLTVNGSDFVSGAKIIFNGNEKNTTFVSDTELNCLIEPADTAPNPQIPTRATVLVKVRIPSGEESANPLSFTIEENYVLSSPKNLSNVGLASHQLHNPDIAADNTGKLYAVWVQADVTGTNRLETFFTASSDRGINWNAPQPVSIRDYYGCAGPALAVDPSGNLNLTWNEETNNNYRSIYYRRSTNRGANWNPIVEIGRSNKLLRMNMALDSANNIDVLWENADSGNHILLGRSVDNGSGWVTINIFDNNSRNKLLPGTQDIAVGDNGLIYVVWEEETAGLNVIYFSRSLDYGSSWSAPANLSNSTNSEKPAIAVGSDGALYVVFAGLTNKNTQLCFLKSSNYGDTWSPIIIFNDQLLYSDPLCIAVDSVGNVNVLSGRWFYRSIDKGDNWTHGKNIAPSLQYHSSPALALDNHENINMAIIAYNETNSILKGDIYFIGCQ